MKSIIFILVFCFFIFLGYLDHSKYDIIYNPFIYPSSQLEKNKINYKITLAAIIGGFFMGFGARLAFGCNIGALFSGIASGSLHGWAWFLFAFIGAYFGVKARRWFYS